MAVEGKSPDYATWAKYPCWKLEEAVALLSGMDPHVTNMEYVEIYSPEVRDLLEIVRRAVAIGELKEPNTPGTHLAWARSRNIKVPAELETAVRSFQRQSSKSEESPRRKKTELRIILGMSIDTYRYDLQAPRTSTARLISERINALRLGFTVSEDTVRDILNEAKEELG